MLQPFGSVEILASWLSRYHRINDCTWRELFLGSSRLTSNIRPCKSYNTPSSFGHRVQSATEG